MQEFVSLCVSTTVDEEVCVLCVPDLRTHTHTLAECVHVCVSVSLQGWAITVMDGPCVEAVIICYVSGCV